MKYSITKARANLYRLIDEINETHQPIIISGRKNSAVLISLDDFKIITEKAEKSAKNKYIDIT
jgi:prevent-host-death family protein